jgi:hypothetical protein
MGWFVPMYLHDSPEEAEAAAEAEQETSEGVVCRECGMDDGTRSSEHLCETCGWMWMARKRGWTVH